MAIMLIGPLEASALGLMLRMLGARRVLEVGCFTGYSALAMAEQLPENGEVVTLDISAETTAIGERYWKQSRHGKKIKLILGPAIETMKSLQGPFDFVFIDADKENYGHYFNRALELLSPRGVIVLDNALRDGEVLKESPDAGTLAIRELCQKIHQDPRFYASLLPIRDGMMIVQRVDRA